MCFGAVESKAPAESPSGRSAAHHHQAEEKKEEEETQAEAEPEDLPVSAAAESSQDPGHPGSDPPGITVDLTTLDDHQSEDEGCKSESPQHSETDMRTETLPELRQRRPPPEQEEESHQDPEDADPGCIVVEETIRTSPNDTAGSPED